MNTNGEQGGSVMCVRRLNSDPAHLHFSLNCLLNEEEIKTPKNHLFFKKNVYEHRSPPTQINQRSKKCGIRYMKLVVIKKASQEEQKNWRFFGTKYGTFLQ